MFAEEMPKKPMAIVRSILVILFVIPLAACQARLPITATPSSTAVIPMETSAVAVPGCTVVSAEPTAGPTEQSLFPAVTDKDWVRGSEVAKITILEYADFQ